MIFHDLSGLWWFPLSMMVPLMKRGESASGLLPMHSSRLLLSLTASIEGLLTSSVSAVSMRHHILDATSNANHLRLLLTEQDSGRNVRKRSRTRSYSATQTGSSCLIFQTMIAPFSLRRMGLVQSVQSSPHQSVKMIPNVDQLTGPWRANHWAFFLMLVL